MTIEYLLRTVNNKNKDSLQVQGLYHYLDNKGLFNNLFIGLLGKQQIFAIVSNISIQQIPPHTAIIHQGNHNNNIYALLEGQLYAFKRKHSRNQFISISSQKNLFPQELERMENQFGKVIRTIRKPYTVFGQISPLFHQVSTTTIYTNTHSKILSFKLPTNITSKIIQFLSQKANFFCSHFRLAQLNYQKLHFALKLFREQTLRKGTCIDGQLNEMNKIYIIKKGQIRIQKSSYMSNDWIGVGTIGQGQVINLSIIFRNIPSQYRYIIQSQKSSFYTITYKQFKTLPIQIIHSFQLIQSMIDKRNYSRNKNYVKSIRIFDQFKRRREKLEEVKGEGFREMYKEEIDLLSDKFKRRFHFDNGLPYPKSMFKALKIKTPHRNTQSKKVQSRQKQIYQKYCKSIKNSFRKNKTQEDLISKSNSAFTIYSRMLRKRANLNMSNQDQELTGPQIKINTPRFHLRLPKISKEFSIKSEKTDKIS